MLFYFKQHPEDFLVEEILGFEPDGEKEFLYVFFEKKEKNTMDILDFLMRRFSLKREQLGIAGLKDRVGFTRQRISIGLHTLKNIGGQELFLNELKKHTTLIHTKFHSQLLKVGQHSGNRFQIRLRAKCTISPELKKKLSKKISLIDREGFANYFGKQRFGKGLKNYKRAVKIFEEGDYNPKDYVLRFQLQAWSSMQFNRFLQMRVIAGYRYLPGDILMRGSSPYLAETAVLDTDHFSLFDYAKEKQDHKQHDFFSPESLYGTQARNQQSSIDRVPSGPFLGKNLLLPPNGSDAWHLERNFLKRSKFLINGIDICEHVGIWGLRRALWVRAENIVHNFEQDDLLLSFSLPTGAYATVFLAALFQDTDPKTYEGQFKIPL